MKRATKNLFMPGIMMLVAATLAAHGAQPPLPQPEAVIQQRVRKRPIDQIAGGRMDPIAKRIKIH